MIKYIIIGFAIGIVAASWAKVLIAQEYYCVPYEKGVEYQEKNGWTVTVPTNSDGSQKWTHPPSGKFMITIEVPNIYQPWTGRHIDMMCQVR